MKIIISVFFIFFFIVSCTSVETTERNDESHEKELKKEQRFTDIDGIYHKVEKGENLTLIAQAYNIPIEDISSLNEINENDLIFEGDELFIPFAIKPIKIAKIVKKEENIEKSEDIEKKEKEKEKKITDKYKKSFIWPVNGVIVSKFGKRGNVINDGIDIAAPTGFEIKSVLKGKVIFSGNQKGYGNIIIIEHEEDIISIYSYNSKNIVKEKEIVKEGQIIGYVGISQRDKVSKLHFEIRIKTKPVNPLIYLKDEI